jgi:hypothetical protein
MANIAQALIDRTEAAAIFRDELADDEVEQIAVVRRQQPPRNFYAQRKKDTVLPRILIERTEAAAIFRDELADDEVKQIAVVQRQQPPRNNNNFNTASTRAPAANAAPIGSNSPRNPNIVCRYCKKKGHMQRECHSRRRDRAPMVDANGKKYESRINNVADDENVEEKEEPQYEDTHVGAVANLNPHHHLNW